MGAGFAPGRGAPAAGPPALAAGVVDEAPALNPQQLDAVVNYVYHSTNTKLKSSKTTP